MKATSKAHFLGHEPCPKCGSRDNLARYSDNSAWCFGCGYLETAVRTLASARRGITNMPEKSLNYTQDLPKEAILWLKQYEISDAEIKSYGFVWDTDRKRLVYITKDKEGKPAFWQGRRFGEGPKYLSWGTIPEIQVFGSGRSVVMVEDVLSAIKVARHTAASPLFGSHVSAKALEALSSRFESLVVWLDPDKTKEAAKAVLRGLSCGYNITLVLSDKDPKEHTDREILKCLSLS